MAASLRSTTLLLALLLALSTFASAAENKAAAKAMSVWDQLEYNGLPRGLLPDSVVSYTLNEDDRTFVVELAKPCYVQFKDLVWYDTKVTGTLSFGSIKNLKGVQAKKLLLWYTVSAIEADIGNGVVEFKVGLATQTYPESDFRAVPSCKKNLNGGAVFPCRGSNLFFPQLEKLALPEV